MKTHPEHQITSNACKPMRIAGRNSSAVIHHLRGLLQDGKTRAHERKAIHPSDARRVEDPSDGGVGSREVQGLEWLWSSMEMRSTCRKTRRKFRPAIFLSCSGENPRRCNSASRAG